MAGPWARPRPRCPRGRPPSEPRSEAAQSQCPRSPGVPDLTSTGRPQTPQEVTSEDTPRHRASAAPGTGMTPSAAWT